MRAFYLVVDENYEPVAAAQAARLLTLSRADIHIFVELRQDNPSWEPSVKHERIFYHVNRLTELLPDRLPSDDKWPSIVYMRIFVPQFLEGYERLIYLDADIYVNYVPEWIWQVPLPHGLAAVHDTGILGERAPGHTRSVQLWLEAIGLKGKRYFNSGVMVIDGAQWRSHNWKELLETYFEKYGSEVRAFDQDFLNFVFDGKWLELSPRFNFQVTLFYYGLEAFFEPCFLHFTDGAKPWQPEKKLYHPSIYSLYTDLFAASGIRPRRHPQRVTLWRRLRDAMRKSLTRLGFVTRRERRLRKRRSASTHETHTFIVSSLDNACFADPLPDTFTISPPKLIFDGRNLLAPHVPVTPDPLLPAERVSDPGN